MKQITQNKLEEFRRALLSRSDEQMAKNLKGWLEDQDLDGMFEPDEKMIKHIRETLGGYVTIIDGSVEIHFREEGLRQRIKNLSISDLNTLCDAVHTAEGQRARVAGGIEPSLTEITKSLLTGQRRIDRQ